MALQFGILVTSVVLSNNLLYVVKFNVLTNFLIIKILKTKWLSEEVLPIAVKRREVKSKAEKQRYKHLNAEFQRIARRDKKAFLSNQCKEIKENNRIGKTRDLFKKLEIPREHFMQRWAQ